MRALLYADYCTLKKILGQFMLSVALFCGMITFLSISGSGIPADEAAGIIQSNIACTGTLMFAFYAFFALFGQDEHAGWESVRLSLPFTRWQLVASRYIFMMLILIVLLAIGSLLGAAVAAAVCMLRFGAVTFMPIDTVLAAIVLCISASAIYLGIEMPLFFKMGLTKARPYFTFPFFACMLFTLDPVQKAAEGLGSKVMGLADAIGSPAPLMLGALVVSLGIYAISSRISLAIYRTREF